MIVLALVFGLLCGVALGLTGGGGSILAVPLLVYGLHLPVHQAIAISLLVVGVTALVGFVPRLKIGEVEISAGLTLAIMGMLFAPIGSYVGHFVPDGALITAFSVLMLAIGLWSWIKSRLPVLNAPKKTAACQYLPSGKLQLKYKCRGALMFAGCITGLLTGLFGVGGGFLIVPALIVAAKMPLRKAITTSLMIIFLVSMVGLISHSKNTSIPWEIGMLFIVGGALGMLGASWLKHKIHTQHLQKIFAVLIMGLGLVMLIHQLCF